MSFFTNHINLYMFVCIQNIFEHNRLFKFLQNTKNSVCHLRVSLEGQILHIFRDCHLSFFYFCFLQILYAIYCNSNLTLLSDPCCHPFYFYLWKTAFITGLESPHKKHLIGFIRTQLQLLGSVTQLPLDFFNVVLPMQDIFLTTFYGLYIQTESHIFISN